MPVEDINEVITHFWNTYEAEGVEAALNEARAHSQDDDLKAIEEAVPALVEEARNRNIDILNFLSELDEARANEAQVDAGEEDASGTDDGTSELSADSSDEASEPQAEDESSPARDADGEDRS